MKNYFINKTPKQAQLELAKRFKETRKTKKISQTELATKSGVSLGSIKRFEYTGQISLESVLKLAHYFDNLDEFDSIFKQNDELENIEKLFNQ